jgi:hypothetical protein
MACEEFEEDLSAWIDGELTRAEQARLVAHLESCPHCRETLSEFKQTSALVRGLATPRAPASVTDPALRLVRSGVHHAGDAWTSRLKRLLFEPFFPKVGIEVMGLAAAVVLAVFVGREVLLKDASDAGKVGDRPAAPQPPPASGTAPNQGAEPFRSFGSRGQRATVPAAGSDLSLPRYYDFREAKTHGRRDVASFNDAERLAWQNGAWRHELRFGREGWWWVVNGAWYWYKQPTDGPPAYVSDIRFAVPLPAAPRAAAPRPPPPPPAADAPAGPKQ